MLFLKSLELVRILNSLNQLSDADGKRILPTLGADVFNSSKLTQKLTQELTDPLVVSAKTMPVWCANLVHDYPCFFSMNTRVMYLNTAGQNEESFTCFYS
jgi:E3 ubiquitin-protein ligase HECTD1